MKKLFIFIAALLPLLIFSVPIAKAQFLLTEENQVVEQKTTKNNIRSYERIVLSSEEVVNDNYFAQGENITISGIVNGDLYAAGSTVFIDGTINGDVLVAGGQLTIRGPVHGDVRAAGGNVTVSSEVSGNVTLLGGNLSIQDSANVGGSVVAAGGNVDIFAPVGKSITAAVGQLTIGGSVGGDIKAGVGTMTIAPSSTVDGDIIYASDNQIEILSGASVKGAVIQKIKAPKIETPETEKVIGMLAGIGVLFKVLGLITTFILGLLFIWLFPNYTERVSGSVLKRPGMSIVTGLAAVILTPLAALGLLLTIVGAPISLILFVSYITVLCLAKVFVVYAIGKKLLSSAQSKWIVLLGGTVIYGVVTLIPIIGGFANLIVLLLGVGALLIEDKNLYTSLRTKKIL